MMKKTVMVLATVVAVGGVAGCSGDKGGSPLGGPDPKETFSKALQAQMDATSLSQKIKLDADESTMSQVMSNPDESDEEKKDTAKIAKIMSMTSVLVEAKTLDGKKIIDAQDTSNMDMGMFVDMKDSRVINVLAQKKQLFLKMDPYKMAEQTQMFSKGDIDKAMSSMQETPWLQKLVHNEWIGLDEQMSAMAKEGMKSADPTKGEVSGKTDMSAAQRRQLMEATKTNLLTNSTFKKNGDVIQVEVAPKKFAPQFMNDMKKISPDTFKPEDEKKMNDSLAKLTDKPFVMACTVKDDKFAKVSMDAMQMYKIMDPNKLTEEQDKKDYEKFRHYTVNFVSEMSSEPQELKVPENFTKVTQQDLQGLMGGAMDAPPSTKTS